MFLFVGSDRAPVPAIDLMFAGISYSTSTIGPGSTKPVFAKDPTVAGGPKLCVGM